MKYNRYKNKQKIRKPLHANNHVLNLQTLYTFGTLGVTADRPPLPLANAAGAEEADTARKGLRAVIRKCKRG